MTIFKRKTLHIFLMATVLLSIALVRTVLAGDVFVNSDSGVDNSTCGAEASPCLSIKHAAEIAQNNDTIHIPAGTYSESVFIGTGKILSFLGAGTTGANQTSISPPSGVGVIVGQSSNWIFTNLIVEGAESGGINNAGTITLIDSIVRNNTSTSEGGGINNTGILGLRDSTIENNSTTKNGGGIYNDGGEVVIVNSTISGNKATGNGSYGGGIYSKDGTFAIYSGTIASNSATVAGGGINRWGTAVFNIYNTMVAKNSGGGNLSNCNDKLQSKGHFNLEDQDGCGFDTGNGDIVKQNPSIGDLADNGGGTPTHALSSSSPAVDHGNPQGCRNVPVNETLKSDQRGLPRSIGSACDIGAYERGVCGDNFKEADEECDGGNDCESNCKLKSAVAANQGGQNSGASGDTGSSGKTGCALIRDDSLPSPSARTGVSFMFSLTLGLLIWKRWTRVVENS